MARRHRRIEEPGRSSLANSAAKLSRRVQLRKRTHKLAGALLEVGLAHSSTAPAYMGWEGSGLIPVEQRGGTKIMQITKKGMLLDGKPIHNRKRVLPLPRLYA